MRLLSVFLSLFLIVGLLSVSAVVSTDGLETGAGMEMRGGQRGGWSPIFFIFWIIRFNRIGKHEQRRSCLLTAATLDEAVRTPHHSGCTSLLKHLSVAVQASLASLVFGSCCLRHPCEMGLF